MNSGKCADVNGDPLLPGNDGDNVAQWTCGGITRSNQVWYLTDAGDGSYYITAAHSGKCLDVAGGTEATENGANVAQWTCLGFNQTNQRWRIENRAWQKNRSTFTLVAVHSGKCLDVEGGIWSTRNKANIHQWECLGFNQTNQRWYLISL